MKYSKRKSPQTKLLRIKSNQNIVQKKPIGSLLSQINNLKQQLRDIKRNKKQDYGARTLISPKAQTTKSKQQSQDANTYFRSVNLNNSQFNNTTPKVICYTQKQSQLQIQQPFSQTKGKIIKNKQFPKETYKQLNHSNTDNYIENGLNINQIYFKQKDKKLKMDLQLNKIKKIIRKIEGELIIQPLNCIISLINYSNQEYIEKIQFLQKTQITQEEVMQIQIQKQQLKQLKAKYSEMQSMNRKMKKQLIQKEADQLKLKQYNQFAEIQISQINSKLQQYLSLISNLQTKKWQLQQKNRIYESKIDQKEEKLIFSQEDANYLRLESQNFKNQKKQLQDLYNKLEQEFKQFKKLKNGQFQKLQSEKAKFQKQCKLRRSQSEQIQEFQSQRNILLKQIQQLRILCDLKSSEYQVKKKQIYELRQKLITLQSQFYKIKSENQTLKNQKDYYNYEIQQLNKQVNQLKDVKRYKVRIDRSLSKQKNSQSVQSSAKVNLKQKKESESLQKNHIKSTINEKKYVPLGQRQNKLKALDEIHLLIKKHKSQIQI